MSVAEKLRAEGRVEGQEKGLWIGKIQILQEFLNLPVRLSADLAAMTVEELELNHWQLHRDYQARFKR